jgi:hypothetical protein
MPLHSRNECQQSRRRRRGGGGGEAVKEEEEEEEEQEEDEEEEEEVSKCVADTLYLSLRITSPPPRPTRAPRLGAG